MRFAIRPGVGWAILLEWLTLTTGKICLTLAMAEASWRKFSDRLSLKMRSEASETVIDMFFG